MQKIRATKTVGTSLTVSISDVLLNLVVALFTGSVVMLSQALQGVSDLVTAGFLYYGVRRSKRRRDKRHQFGYGKEAFFWVIIAAIFMFFGTGLLSIYFGYHQLVDPGQIRNLPVAFGMLTFGFVTNLYAFSLSVRRLDQTAGNARWWKRFTLSTMVETKATFLIDFLGTVAAGIGLLALGSFVLSGDTGFDGLGGIVIGVSMMVGALLLVYDVKGLIVGRAVAEETAHKISRAARGVDGVEDVLDLRTMYIGASKLLVIIEVHLRDGLETNAIEAISDRIKASVQSVVPYAHTVQVEIETPAEELTKEAG